MMVSILGVHLTTSTAIGGMGEVGMWWDQRIRMALGPVMRLARDLILTARV